MILKSSSKMTSKADKAKKKPFEKVSGYKIATTLNTIKYVTHGRRAAIAIFDEPAGLIPKGSKHMLEVFELHKLEFEIAAKKDTLGLNDADTNVANAIFPPTALTKDNLKKATEDIKKQFYTGASNIPKFPIRISLMNQDDVCDFFLPLLRQDIAECTSRSISRIPWRDSASKPKCWPDEIARYNKIN